MTTASKRPRSRTNARPLSTSPLNLLVIHGNGKAWRYEEPGGLCVVVEVRYPDGALFETVQVRVPVGVMRTYLDKIAE